jgi:hypothetical protein
VGHIWVGALLIHFLRPPISNQAALVGILLGSIGAFALYYEGILTEADIANISAKFAREGQPRFPGAMDWSATVFNALAGALVGGAIPDTRHLAGLATASLFAAVLGGLTFMALKAAHKWQCDYTRQVVRRFEMREKKDYITRSFRRAGFILVVSGAWAQIPLILSAK